MSIVQSILVLLALELSHARALLRFTAASGDNATQESRGIVMSCPAAEASAALGGWKPNDLYKGFATAAMGLRKMGCQLPIYNMVYEDELPGIQQQCEELNKRIGDVSCAGIERDASGYGYSKVLAVKHVPVNQVLFLDCDAFLVRDPTYMFDDPSFIATGALFWADIEGHFASEGRLHAALAVVPKERKEKYGDKWWFRQGYDSALLLIDKQKSKESFDFLLTMLTTSSGKYDLDSISMGDKDLWHVAWLAKGPPCDDESGTCSLMPWAGAIGDCPQDDKECHICSQAKLDRQGLLLAIHQIWTVNGSPVPPSLLISVNIDGKGAADAAGPYPNDDFYGFHDGIAIDQQIVKKEFSNKAVTNVPDDIQTLVFETHTCWQDYQGNCALSAI